MASVSEVRKVGRYEVLREIGRGGTAVVYLARQTDLDRMVALKELAAFRASDPAFVERFLRESRVTGALNHPNIVTVYEYFEHDGIPFIAMEYFARGSLRPYVGRLELSQIAGVLEGLSTGLAHAESQGIVHRDLKPENVMVTTAGGVKIADFGMAKVRELHAAAELTASGTTVGTPAYMAPEQALGSAVTPATDLYSVGVIAYELLAGRVPFDRDEAPMATMLRHLNDPVPPLLSLEPGLDPALAAYVERLLSKDPTDRPQSAGAASDELEEIVIEILGPRWRRTSRLVDAEQVPVDTAPAAAERTNATLRVTRRFATRRKRTLVGSFVAAGLLVGAGVAAALVLSDDSPTSARTSQTTTSLLHTSAKPVSGPAVADIKLTKLTDPVRATLYLTGPAFARGSLHMSDDDLSDGHATVLLRQRGVTARTTGGRAGPLTLLIRKARGLVRVDVVVNHGSFTTLRARRIGEHRVVLEAARYVPPPSAPPPSGGETTTATTTMTTTTTTTQQPPPVRKKTHVATG